MPLKIFGKQAKSSSSEAPLHTYLCLMFANQSVQAALWKIDGEKVKTLAQSALLTFEDEEDGLLKADEALQELGSESENVSEVVFGFDPGWVDDAGLLKEKKPFIKSLTENLGLTPVGFVVITDALTQQILAKDSMASEVLIYTQLDTVSVFLLKQGKLVHQLSVGRSGDIVQDVVEALARAAESLSGKDAYLPAKIVLASPVLSPQEMDDAQQQLASYNWSENHPFVQTPVAETMLSLDVLYAVVEQGGIAVAEAKGLKAKQVESDDEAAVEADAEDFGFESVDSPVAAGDNFAAPASQTQATSFGVPIAEEKMPEEPVRQAAATPLVKKPFKLNKRMPKFMRKLHQWYVNHPHKKGIQAGFLGGLLALVVMIIGWTAMAYQVEVSVRLAEEVINKQVAITIDPTARASDPEQLLLKGSLETVEVDGQETAETTGATLVGERASGTVVIFNKTSASKTFAAGTSLSTGSVAFTLNDDVSVASASSEESGNQAITTFGETEAAVTASSIGAEGNIGDGTELTVADFSDSTYAAAAKGGFNGGSSQEVRVVSEEDQERLFATLQQRLLAAAEEEFDQKSGNGVYYVPTSTTTVEQEKYSADVNDEAAELVLDLTLTVTGVQYRSDDLRPIWEAALAEDIPEGFKLIDEDPEFLSEIEAASDSSAVILKAEVKAKARPPLDEQVVIDSILGVSLKSLAAQLQERSEIEAAEYLLKPRFADIFISKVPKAADRVQLTISN